MPAGNERFRMTTRRGAEAMGYRPVQAAGIGVGFLILAVAVWTISIGAGQDIPHGAATAGLILICGICVLYDLRAFGSNLFSPLLTVSLYLMVFFGLGPWLAAITTNQSRVTAASRAQMTLYIAAGTILLLLGYVWGGRSSERQIGSPAGRLWTMRSVVWTALFFVAAGTVGVYLYFASVGGITAYLDSFGNRISLWNKGQGIYVMLLESGQTGILIWCAHLFYSRPVGRRFGLSHITGTILLLLIVSAMRLALGSRTGLLWPVLACVILYNNHRRRVKVLELIVVVTCAVGVVYAYGEARMLLGRNKGVENLGNLTMDRYTLIDQFRTQYGTMLDVTLAITDAVPDAIPYQLGKTYALGVAYLIPRQIWRDKPPSAAELLSDEIYAGTWNGSSYITPGLWGEAYLNFGSIGWLVVPLVLGVVLRKMASHGLPETVTPTASVMYVYYFQFTNGIAIGDFVNVMVRLLPQLAMAWLACRLLDSLASDQVTLSAASGAHWHKPLRRGLSM
jgi:hypothetical protein